jgi:hypothetical protein
LNSKQALQATTTTNIPPVSSSAAAAATTTTTTTKKRIFPKPKGAAPEGKVWSTLVGKWLSPKEALAALAKEDVKEEEAGRSSSGGGGGVGGDNENEKTSEKDLGLAHYFAKQKTAESDFVGHARDFHPIALLDHVVKPPTTSDVDNLHSLPSTSSSSSSSNDGDSGLATPALVEKDGKGEEGNEQFDSSSDSSSSSPLDMEVAELEEIDSASLFGFEAEEEGDLDRNTLKSTTTPGNNNNIPNNKSKKKKLQFKVCDRHMAEYQTAQDVSGFRALLPWLLFGDSPDLQRSTDIVPLVHHHHDQQQGQVEHGSSSFSSSRRFQHASPRDDTFQRLFDVDRGACPVVSKHSSSTAAYPTSSSNRSRSSSSDGSNGDGGASSMSLLSLSPPPASTASVGELESLSLGGLLPAAAGDKSEAMAAFESQVI